MLKVAAARVTAHHPAPGSTRGGVRDRVVRSHPRSREPPVMTLDLTTRNPPRRPPLLQRDPSGPAAACSRAVGLGGATVVVAGTGALSYRVYDTAVLDPGSGTAYRPVAAVARHARAARRGRARAVLAASPHNTQPWIFGVGADAIDVFVDPARGTGTVDPFGREQYVGLGCALENLVLGCRARGLEPHGDAAARTAPTAPGSRTSSLVRRATDASPLYDAIGDRHTNRGPYDGRPVPARTARRSGRRRPGLPGSRCSWIADPDAEGAHGSSC